MSAVENNNEGERFLNFPIKMMQGVLSGRKDKDEFLREILHYCLFKHSNKIKDAEIEYPENDLDRFKRTAKYFNVTMNNPSHTLGSGLVIFKRYEKANVFTGLNIKTYWNFRNGERTEHDWRCLFAYLALKSIIGNKTFAKTDNKMMFARMYGKDSKKDFDKMSVSITRYQRDKKIFDLQCFWNLKYYAYGVWGFYYSFDKISLEKLVLTAESKKKKNQMDLLRDARENARQDALKILSKK